MNQFTIIITEQPNRTNYKIKNGRENKLEEKAKTYIVTDDGHRILVKPPRGSKLKGYQADVVINETQHTQLSKIPAKPDAIIIETQ